ncbi:MAG: polyprenol monophosphomannose synthase [bacterium]
MSNLELSVIVPTFNEAKNIGLLINHVFKATTQAQIFAELIIVDDQSPDGTAKIAEEIGEAYGVRVFVRAKRDGLGSAILDGIKLAQAPVICVMDADLSHPAETIPEMYKIIKKGRALMVVGSRHVKGGSTSKWIWYRKFLSWGARKIAGMITPVKDLTSGFFMFDKQIIDGVDIKPIGWKVGLELMVKGKHQGKIVEHPIIFTERASGESKAGLKETFQYLQHISALAWHKISAR